jgi:hypothetical protein
MDFQILWAENKKIRPGHMNSLSANFARNSAPFHRRNHLRRRLVFPEPSHQGKQQTHLKKTAIPSCITFFNFIGYNIDEGFHNPCDAPVMKKMFRVKRAVHWDILEKETVDEIS